MDNQLIDEALSLYNYLRLHAYKVLTYSEDRVRLDKLVLRAFYRYERRIRIKRLYKLYKTYNKGQLCLTKPTSNFLSTDLFLNH